MVNTPDDQQPRRRASNKTIGKTINGVGVTQNAFKRAVVEAIQAMDGGEGRVEDLLPIIGPEWDTPDQRKVLAKTLNNLAAAGVLIRNDEKRGLYRVARGFHRSGVSVSDQIEQGILHSLRKRGGIASFSEIMEDHDLRAHGEELREIRAARVRRHSGTETTDDALKLFYDVRNQTSYLQMRQVMSTSENIRQDFSFHRGGIYNLHPDELNRMPLRGLYAAYQIKTTWDDFKKPNRFTAERDDFFTRVGSVYQEARRMRGLNPLEFVQRAGVKAAIYELSMNRKVKAELDRRYMDTTMGRLEEMRQAGAPPAERTAYREDRRNSREGQGFAIELLERFEFGGSGPSEDEQWFGVNVHSNAPVSFYVALAKELGICPVAATRGYLTLDVSGPAVRPKREAPDHDRLAELEEEREARRDANDAGRHPEGRLIFPDDEED